MGLELGVELVLAGFFLQDVSAVGRHGPCKEMTCRFVPLEQHDTAAFVAGCEVVAGLIKFDSGDDVGCARCQQLHAGINRVYSGPKGMERLHTFGYVFHIAFVAEASAAVSASLHGMTPSVVDGMTSVMRGPGRATGGDGNERTA